MGNPAISVIIPVYNAEEYVDRCVASVVNQSIENIEVLLIDDGSTDNSQKLCKTWAARDGRIRVLWQENGGVASARNKGMEAAAGRCLMFLDSDDMFFPEACEVLLNTLDNKGADCVICGTKEASGFRWAPRCNRDYVSPGDFKHDFAEWLGSELLSPVWNKIFKRDKVAKLFDSEMSYGEDLSFTLEYLKSCERISFITDTLHFHDKERCDSLTRTFNPGRFRDIERTFTAILDFVGEKPAAACSEKYVRDSINFMYSIYATSAIDANEKRNLLASWHAMSRLKDLPLSSHRLALKERLMLAMWKRQQFLWYPIFMRFKNKLSFLF